MCSSPSYAKVQVNKRFGIRVYSVENHFVKIKCRHMASLYKLNSYFPKHHSCVKLLHISVLTCFHWLFRVFIFKPFHVCRGQTTGLLSEVQLKKWINVYNIRLTKDIESCLMKNKDKRQELLLNRTTFKWEAGDVSGSNLSCAVATAYMFLWQTSLGQHVIASLTLITI